MLRNLWRAGLAASLLLISNQVVGAADTSSVNTPSTVSAKSSALGAPVAAVEGKRPVKPATSTRPAARRSSRASEHPRPGAEQKVIRAPERTAERTASRRAGGSEHSTVGTPRVMRDRSARKSEPSKRKVDATRGNDFGYLYMGVAKDGKHYIGRSKDLKNVKRRWSSHNKRLDAKLDWQIIGRAKNGMDLRVMEDMAIQQHGGPGNLRNRRNEMSGKSRRAAAATPPRW